MVFLLNFPCKVLLPSFDLALMPKLAIDRIKYNAVALNHITVLSHCMLADPLDDVELLDGLARHFECLLQEVLEGGFAVD